MQDGSAGSLFLQASLLIALAAGALLFAGQRPLVAQAPDAAEVSSAAPPPAGETVEAESEVRSVPENDSLTMILTGMLLLLGATVRRQLLSRRRQ